MVIARGTRCNVECAVLVSGDAPAKDFLENELRNLKLKGKQQPNANAEAKLLRLFWDMAMRGRVLGKHFGPEAGKLYGFKHEVMKKLIRFPCFSDGNKWILTHGFYKPGAQSGKGKWPEREIDRANTIMSVYYGRKQQLLKAIALGGR
jgi:hypothetical protein